MKWITAVSIVFLTSTICLTRKLQILADPFVQILALPQPTPTPHTIKTCLAWLKKTFDEVGFSFMFSGVSADITETCQARNETYSISDSEQCDKYYVCEKTGKTTERLCDDGFVFSEAIRQCDYPHNSDCSKRPKLRKLSDHRFIETEN